MLKTIAIDDEPIALEVIKSLAANVVFLEVVACFTNSFFAIREVLDDRLSLCVGVDDVIVEAIGTGAVGWIAGLVNAYPAESVELFNLAKQGKSAEAFALYRWFLPLLRLDTVPKFVQLIKWVQEQAGVGSARVRAPRLELQGDDLKTATAVYEKAMANRPAVNEKPIADFAGA